MGVDDNCTDAGVGKRWFQLAAWDARPDERRSPQDLSWEPPLVSAVRVPEISPSS